VHRNREVLIPLQCSVDPATHSISDYTVSRSHATKYAYYTPLHSPPVLYHRITYYLNFVKSVYSIVITIVTRREGLGTIYKYVQCGYIE